MPALGGGWSLGRPTTSGGLGRAGVTADACRSVSSTMVPDRDSVANTSPAAVIAAPRSSRRGDSWSVRTCSARARLSPRWATPSAVTSQTASSGVARASTSRAAARSWASRGAPPTTAPLLGELSTISTSAAGACPGTPRSGSVGPAAASTSATISKVRRRRRRRFWSLSRRWCSRVVVMR
jgi:hypothetical protein